MCREGYPPPHAKKRRGVGAPCPEYEGDTSPTYPLSTLRKGILSLAGKDPTPLATTRNGASRGAYENYPC